MWFIGVVVFFDMVVVVLNDIDYIGWNIGVICKELGKNGFMFLFVWLGVDKNIDVVVCMEIYVCCFVFVVKDVFDVIVEFLFV